jgi:hypothetical protein
MRALETRLVQPKQHNAARADERNEQNQKQLPSARETPTRARPCHLSAFQLGGWVDIKTVVSFLFVSEEARFRGVKATKLYVRATGFKSSQRSTSSDQGVRHR